MEVILWNRQECGNAWAHQQDRCLLLCVQRNERNTAKVSQHYLQWVSYVYVSDQTVRNQLHKAGIRAQYPSVVPVLIHQCCAAQLAFTREQQDWQVHYCYPILLIDVAGNIMFSMVSPGHPFWCFLVNSRHTARCWAVSTGPASGGHVLIKASEYPTGGYFVGIQQCS